MEVSTYSIYLRTLISHKVESWECSVPNGLSVILSVPLSIRKGASFSSIYNSESITRVRYSFFFCGLKRKYGSSPTCKLSNFFKSLNLDYTITILTPFSNHSLYEGMQLVEVSGCFSVNQDKLRVHLAVISINLIIENLLCKGLLCLDRNFLNYALTHLKTHPVINEVVC